MSVAENFKNQSSTENCQKSENGKYANSLSSKLIVIETNIIKKTVLI